MISPKIRIFLHSKFKNFVLGSRPTCQVDARRGKDRVQAHAERAPEESYGYAGTSAAETRGGGAGEICLRGRRGSTWKA